MISVVIMMVINYRIYVKYQVQKTLVAFIDTILTQYIPQHLANKLLLEKLYHEVG